MIISKENWKKICEYEDELYWDIDRMSSDGRYSLDRLTKVLKDVERENKDYDDKIYVIVNNSIIDGEINYSIEGAVLSKKEAKNIFDNVVKTIKKDTDFYNLNAINCNDKTNFRDSCWYYRENEDSFELYLGGEFSYNNFTINLLEFDIKKEKKKEREIE